MKPHALTGVRVNAGEGVDEASAMIHDQVSEAVVSQGVVALPLVSKDDSPWSDVFLDEAQKSVVVPFVVCTLHQEAFPGSPAVASQDPLSDHSPNLDSSISTMCPCPPILLVAPFSRRSSTMH